jgi:hypothetical protein
MAQAVIQLSFDYFDRSLQVRYASINCISGLHSCLHQWCHQSEVRTYGLEIRGGPYLSTPIQRLVDCGSPVSSCTK